MRELTPEELDRLYPAECHVKVIATNIIGIHKRLNEILVEHGIEDKAFQPGNLSKKGKYISYEICLQIETHQQMRRIDSALRLVDGVKMGP